MIGRKFQRKAETEENAEPKGFDDFDLRLGDMMRGERATLGKSLLDVQRDLRIKAAYIAAIENADPSAFDTPGFIAGYVRSYARYLGMDPDKTFALFCKESGFAVARDMGRAAAATRNAQAAERASTRNLDRDPFARTGTPFAPVQDSFFSRIEPRAIGSALVLVALIGGIGFGGWSVLKEIQQVQFAPVDQAPVVLSDLDPLNGVANGAESVDPAAADGTQGVARAEALDRLYRPRALDVPVLVARDAPISTLDPQAGGSFAAPALPQVQLASDMPQGTEGGAVPQVVEDAPQQLRMVTVRPSWVRVSAADGTVIFEGIMEKGQSYDIPATEEPPMLRAGESGAVYFQIAGQHFGPVGDRGKVTKNLPLSIAAVTERFQLADLERDGDLAQMVAEATTAVPSN